jgi:malate/lactate dehydrogenase
LPFSSVSQISKKLEIPAGAKASAFLASIVAARFALALAQRGISGFSFVLGEHGEHQVPVFSMLSHYIPDELRNEILTELRGASMEVIRGKGGTVFGPALHIVRYVDPVDILRVADEIHYKENDDAEQEVERNCIQGKNSKVDKTLVK